MSLTARQLEIRRTGITATDVRVLAGCDPYGRTPHDVWRSKALGDEDQVESEAMELGNALEPIVIPRAAAKVGLHPLRVDPESLTMRHREIAHHVATPDALLATTRLHDPEATAQIKVCGLRTAGAWGSPAEGAEGVPDHVLVQATWEMYVAGLPLAIVGALIGTEVRAYRVERTAAIDDLIGALRQVADRFWTDHVIPKSPPVLDGSEGAARMLSALYPRNRGNVVRAGPEIDERAREYMRLRAESESLSREIERERQMLIAACGDADGIEGDGWRLHYRWREPTEVKAFTRSGERTFDLRPIKRTAKGQAA